MIVKKTDLISITAGLENPKIKCSNFVSKFSHLYYLYVAETFTDLKKKILKCSPILPMPLKMRDLVTC